MKVFAILILAVAAVYAWGEDGNDEDHKQEKKQCKSTPQGCFDFTSDYYNPSGPLTSPVSTIYYPANKIISKDACCDYCSTLTPTPTAYYCLTIYEFQNSFFIDPFIVNPAIGCKFRTALLTTKPLTTTTCIDNYGVAYIDPFNGPVF